MLQLSIVIAFFYWKFHSRYQKIIHKQIFKETLLNDCFQWSSVDDQKIDRSIILMDAMPYTI